MCACWSESETQQPASIVVAAKNKGAGCLVPKLWWCDFLFEGARNIKERCLCGGSFGQKGGGGGGECAVRNPRDRISHTTPCPLHLDLASSFSAPASRDNVLGVFCFVFLNFSSFFLSSRNALCLRYCTCALRSHPIRSLGMVRARQVAMTQHLFPASIKTGAVLDPAAVEVTRSHFCHNGLPLMVRHFCVCVFFEPRYLRGREIRHAVTGGNPSIICMCIFLHQKGWTWAGELSMCTSTLPATGCMFFHLSIFFLFFLLVLCLASRCRLVRRGR